MTYQPMYDLSDIINDQNDLDGKLMFKNLCVCSILNFLYIIRKFHIIHRTTDYHIIYIYSYCRNLLSIY